MGHGGWSSIDYTTPQAGKKGAGCEEKKALGERKGRGFDQGTAGDEGVMDAVFRWIYNVTDGRAGGGAATLQNLYFLSQLVLGAAQAFFTVLALLAAGMRLKRGSTTSTGR